MKKLFLLVIILIITGLQAQTPTPLSSREAELMRQVSEVTAEQGEIYWLLSRLEDVIKIQLDKTCEKKQDYQRFCVGDTVRYKDTNLLGLYVGCIENKQTQEENMKNSIPHPDVIFLLKDCVEEQRPKSDVLNTHLVMTGLYNDSHKNSRIFVIPAGNLTKVK